MPKNLLLADDSITIQKVVGITFAAEDYRVTAVDNGEDALARARELRPDAILADVVMPRKNGYELCEAVKADPQLAGIPVILLAGTFEAFDEARARSVRADAHIAKPFDSQALINKVRELVEGAAPARMAPPGAWAGAPAQPARPAAPPPGPAAPPQRFPAFAAPGTQVPRPRPPTSPGMPPGRPLMPGAPPRQAPQPFAPTRPGMPAAPPAGRSPAAPPPAPARPATPAPFRPTTATPLPMPAAGPPRPATRPFAPAQPAPSPGPGGMAPGRPTEFRPTGPRQIPIPPPGAVPARSPPVAPTVPARRDPFGLDVEAPRGTPGEDWLSVDLAAEARAAADAEAAPAREPPVRPRAPVSPAASPFAPLARPAELDFREETFGAPTGAVAPEPAAAPPPAAPMEIPEVDLEEEVPLELAPMHAFVPPPGEVGHRPEPPAAPAVPQGGAGFTPGGATPADGGEALLREALSRASRDVIERIAWEVVPQLAETIIKEHLERLVRERQGQ